MSKIQISNIVNNKFIKQLTGFSIVGIAVTLFSLGLLYVFINIFKSNVYFAYTVVYIISIAVSYGLNGRLVFKASLNLYSYLIYYGIYLSGMGLGILIIALAKQLFIFDEFINSIIAIPFTMLWNFLLIRYLFTHYSKS